MSVNPTIAAYIAARTQCAVMGATARVRFGGAEYVGIRGTPRDSRDVGSPGRGSMDARNMTVRLLAGELKGDAPKAGDQIDLMGARSTWEPRAVVDAQHATDAATVLLTLGGSMPSIMASWQQADTDALYAQMQRAQTELGKSANKALADTGSYIGHALAAATRVSPKLRRVIANPLFSAGKGATKEDRAAARQAKNDMRRARYGVMAYNADGTQRFVPIGRTGQFGSVRFKSKTTGEYLVREQDGTVRRQEITLGDTEFSTPGIMESPKRRIGRSGLAKKSWQWTARHTLAGGRGQVHDVPAAAEIQWARTGKVIMLRIINYLRYMEKALVGGRQSVDTTVQRATNKMRKAIDERVAAIAEKANKAA